MQRNNEFDFYFGASLYSTMPIIAYKKLGIQTDSNGGKLPPTANMVENRIKRIKLKLSAKPNPMCSPIPPLIFREESETPISVSMNVANG
jgi:hypothetical protein